MNVCERDRVRERALTRPRLRRYSLLWETAAPPSRPRREFPPQDAENTAHGTPAAPGDAQHRPYCLKYSMAFFYPIIHLIRRQWAGKRRKHITKDSQLCWRLSKAGPHRLPCGKCTTNQRPAWDRKTRDIQTQPQSTPETAARKKVPVKFRRNGLQVRTKTQKRKEVLDS